MADFYLLNHNNAIQQYRYPRRERLSGMVGVHSCESIMDDVGPDTGAENVASFIVRRGDYGSYHRICDSDSTVVMAPDDHETWHIGADRHNWHSWGISAACRATDFDPDSPWTQRTIARMGAEIRDFWNRNGFNIQRCARWLTRGEAQTHSTPGLIHHGVAQPSDRSDAWVRHPHRARLDQMLINAILGKAEDDVTPEQITDIAHQAAARTVYLLTNPDGQAQPTYHMGNAETGAPVNLPTIINTLDRVTAQLEALATTLQQSPPPGA